MAISRYSTPMQMPMVPRPWEAIWQSNRQIDAYQAQTEALRSQLATRGFELDYTRDEKRHEQRMAEYEQSSQQIMASKILLSNISTIPNDRPKFEALRNNYLQQINDNVKKYVDNPMVLKAFSSSMSSNIMASMKSGELKNMLDNVEMAKQLSLQAEMDYTKGLHDKYSYKLAKMKAANAQGSPYAPDIAQYYDKWGNKFAAKGKPASQIYQTILDDMEHSHPEWKEYLSMMPQKERDDYLTGIAKAIAEREFMNANGAGTRGSGSGKDKSILLRTEALQGINDKKLGVTYSPMYDAFEDDKEAENYEKYVRRQWNSQLIIDAKTGERVDPRELQAAADENKDSGGITFKGLLKPGSHRYNEIAMEKGVTTRPEDFANGIVFRIGENDYIMDGNGNYDDGYNKQIADINSLTSFYFKRGQTMKYLQSSATGEKISMTAGTDGKPILISPTKGRFTSNVPRDITDMSVHVTNAYQQYLSTINPQLQ